MLIGESEADTVTVSNEGDADLNVSGVSVSGDEGFSLADDAPTSFTLAPGASQDVGVVFAPSSGGRGRAARSPSRDDDADEGSVDVPLSGNGVEEMMTGPSPNAWINELHYDNDGDDVGEFVEVVIERADTLDLSELSVVFYNGSDSETYGSELMLSEFTEGESEGDFTVYSIQEAGIQNGSPDGLALCYQGNPVESGGVAQFLSYEGTITAANGCAAGLTSTDIGVEEGTGTLAGQSLQLNRLRHELPRLRMDGTLGRLPRRRQ